MMQTLAVNWSSLGMGLFIVAFLGCCLLLMLAVLVQKPQGGGLAGAFGSGAGSGQTAFGAKTGDALTWATIILFVLWLITAVGLNLAFQPTQAAAVPELTDPGAGPAADAETVIPPTAAPMPPISPDTTGAPTPVPAPADVEAPVPLQPEPIPAPEPTPTEPAPGE